MRASLQREFAHPGGLVYCSEPQVTHVVSALAPSLRTSLDGIDDGGGISESSGVSEEAADPRSHTPVEASLPRRGCSVSMQNTMVDPIDLTGPVTSHRSFRRAVRTTLTRRSARGPLPRDAG